MELRYYQQDIVNRINEQWSLGHKNVLAQLPTGAGKTVIFSHVIANCLEPSIAIAHRMELVSQISLTLARNGIRHNIIAQKQAIREIISIHMSELGKSYYDLNASRYVAGVDTLLRLPTNTPWFSKIRLVIQDEGHHPLKHNKWGRAAELFPNARGLYPTATPIRADGSGLGRHADGIIDTMVVGIQMRELIREGYLTEYRIFAPPSKLDLSDVTITASGDYSPPKLRSAVDRSQIVGDVVKHYLKIAKGKLGVTFAVSIEAAAQIAKEFQENGVPATVVSGKTPDALRASIMRQFRERKFLQLVNVDLLGEGVDVPAIEVVSMARPTASYALFSQQFGRALRPMAGKSHAIIIDHVGNVARHGLPDAPRTWSLDRREKRSKASEISTVRTCGNFECMAVYERKKRECPICGYYTAPAERSTPAQVDGDLNELDPKTLATLRGEIELKDQSPQLWPGVSDLIYNTQHKNHRIRQAAQTELRSAISLWAGFLRESGNTDSEIYREFYFKFGTDIMTAQILNTKEANKLWEKIIGAIDEIRNTRI